jgi:SAM-dependent methyltransferase
MNALSTPRTVLDLIDEYAEKAANVDAAIAAYERACTEIESAGVVMGTYVSPVLRGRSYVNARDMQKNLLQSGWRAIYNRLNIDMIASANDKRLFERTLADPPPLTPEIVRSTFAHYYADPRKHILRGLAEAFAGLDPAYRSHAKVKIGVKGLPKRVILHSVGAYGNGHGSYGRDQLRDIINALAAYQGKPLMTHNEVAMILEDGEALRYDREIPDPAHSRYDSTLPKLITITGRDVWLKRYDNGNGHLYFGPTALLDINRGLAEFYGDVLPDVDPEQPERAPSTAVAKDLQFYWTPDAVIAKALEFACVHDITEYRYPVEPQRILEPSCGDGRILDAIRKYGHRALGIEYHAGRAEQAKAKGHSVVLSNFLECPPSRDFDAVVMNPPFYGRHYVKHVRHALKFLKPGGTLVAVLPATAHYDHKELEGEWRDLPVGSFSEVGTNVPTGLLKMRAAS